jgi:hypothetical protein
MDSSLNSPLINTQIEFNMKKFLSFQISLFSFFMINAQPTVEWRRNFGGQDDDLFYKSANTQDGALVFIGQTNSNDAFVAGNHGGTDIMISKISVSGNLIWQKTFGGSAIDIGRDIKTTSDGGFVITGYTESEDGDMTANNGKADVWVAKLNNNGNIEWQKNFGGSGPESASSVIQATDGGYLIVGTTESADGIYPNFKGGPDCLIIKLDALGNIEWQKTYGGKFMEYAHQIVQTTDGYTVLCSTSSKDGDVLENNNPFSNPSKDFWLLHLSNTGDILWQNSYGGQHYEHARALIKTEDGGYLMVGSASSEDGDVGEPILEYLDAWVLKVDSLGNILWKKVLGGFFYEYFMDAQQTPEGGYILAGKTNAGDGGYVFGNHGNDDFWVVKLSPEGEFEWQECLGGTHDEIANCVGITSDGGYVVAGFTKSDDEQINGNIGGWDAWVVKYEPEFVGLLPEPRELIGLLEVFPNPARQKTRICTGQPGLLHLSMTDFAGKVVWQQQAMDGAEIDLVQFPNGQYTITARTIDLQTFTGKLIIQQ